MVYGLEIPENNQLTIERRWGMNDYQFITGWSFWTNIQTYACKSKSTTLQIKKKNSAQIKKIKTINKISTLATFKGMAMITQETNIYYICNNSRASQRRIFLLYFTGQIGSIMLPSVQNWQRKHSEFHFPTKT